jgi:class 3 adenylate cyclase
LNTVKILVILIFFIFKAAAFGKDILPRSIVFGDFNKSQAILKLNTNSKNKIKNLGYNSDPFWIKYSFSKSESNFYLSIKNTLYEEVELHTQSKKISPIRIFPFYAFEIPAGTHFIYLKGKSNLIIDTTLEKHEKHLFLTELQFDSLAILFYLVIISFLFSVCSVLAYRRKSSLLRDYALIIFSLHGLALLPLFFGSVVNYYKTKIFFIDNPVYFSVVASEFLACYFSAQFLFNIGRKPKKFYKLKKIIQRASLLFFAITFITQSPANAIGAILLSLITIGFGIKMTLRKDVTHFYGKKYLYAWTALSLGIVGFLLHYIGLVNNYNFRYLIFVGAIAELLIVASIVYNIIGQKEEGLKFMQFSLSGMISESTINDIVKGGKKLALESSQQKVTVLITDIKGFSKMSEEDPDPSNFVSKLTRYNSILSEIVHAHNGIINKTVGDSLVCYFGYTLTGNFIPNHAQSAVDCAVQIQKALVHLYLEGEIQFPTRIGIDKGIVSFGNINPQGGIDFTMIGDVVNMAKRYETACEPFFVLISDKVKKTLSPESFNFDKKFIHIKHTTSLIESWEVDPFFNCDQSHYNIDLATEKLLSSGKKGAEVNYSFNKKVNFTVIEPITTKFEVYNYSLNGMALKSKLHLSREVCLMGEVLDYPIVADILRVEKHSDGYILGLSYSNLTTTQKQNFLNKLHEINNFSKKKVA